MICFWQFVYYTQCTSVVTTVYMFMTCIILLSFASYMWFKGTFYCNFVVHFFDSIKSVKMCDSK